MKFDPKPAQDFSAPSGGQCRIADTEETWSLHRREPLPDRRSVTSEATVKLSRLPGACFDRRYRIICCLGKGGMSVIYKAKDLMLNRVVALKLLDPDRVKADPLKLSRLQREARAAANLHHPNIVQVYDFQVTQDGQPYLVMECIEGQTLDDILGQEGVISQERALNIFSQACTALQHAHENGVIHRDIKPSNIMIVTRPDGREDVRIVDFGIAKFVTNDNVSAELTNSGEVFGSPLYMSPEQCGGDTMDARSDVYSLGCVMYEAISGQPPFWERTSVETMMRHMTKAPDRLSMRVPGLLPGLDETIARALVKNANGRQQSMLEFLAELETIAKPVAPLQPQPNWLLGLVKTFPIKLMAGVCALLLILALYAASCMHVLPRVSVSVEWPGSSNAAAISGAGHTR